MLNPEKQPTLILVTIEQAAERTQFCRNTIKKAMRDGELRYCKFGRLTRIRESDLQEWIDGKIVGTLRPHQGSGVASANFQVIEKTMGGRR